MQNEELLGNREQAIGNSINAVEMFLEMSKKYHHYLKQKTNS